MDPYQGDIPKGWPGLVAAVTGAVMWVFRTFLTRKEASKVYVKKVEDDGTRSYVHREEWKEALERMDKCLEESRKWRLMAKDWMERP